MPSKNRIQLKDNKKKRGPKKHVPKMPKNVGRKKRRAFKLTARKSTACRDAYKAGFRLMFRSPVSRHYCKFKLKRLPPPDSYDKNNHFKGVMPGLPGDFHLTGPQAATILQKVSEDENTSYSQLRSVSKTLSYLHFLMTGKDSENWEEVTEELDLHEEKNFKVKRPLKPTVVPSPEQLKTAFTTEYNPECGWPYAMWLTGLICCWCWAVWGCRSNVDLKSLKDSVTHTVNFEQGWGCSAYTEGRNKLPLKKRGTRPWNCFYLCLCPNGKHVRPPVDFELTFDEKGNATPNGFCSCCPITCMDLKMRVNKHRGLGPLKLFSKWHKTPGCWTGNWGNVAQLAIDWLHVQGIVGEFDSNAGRYCLAGWCDRVKAPFVETVEIHGDLPCTWSGYQPAMPRTDYRIRTQSPVPAKATAALKRLVKFFGRGANHQVSHIVKGDLSARLMAAFMDRMGQTELVNDVCERWEAEQKVDS